MDTYNSVQIANIQMFSFSLLLKRSNYYSRLHCFRVASQGRVALVIKKRSNPLFNRWADVSIMLYMLYIWCLLPHSLERTYDLYVSHESL